MFCQKCGSANSDDSAFCIKCGTRLNESVQKPSGAIQNSKKQGADADKTDNSIAIVGFVLSFFFCVAGLICSIIGYNNSKKGAPYKSFAVAGIAVSAVSIAAVLITVIIWIVVISVLF